MYHISNLGLNSNQCPHTDIEGYVPTEDDGPFDLTFDHGSESTHDEDGELTEYGQWWEDEGWPEKVAAATQWSHEFEHGKFETA